MGSPAKPPVFPHHIPPGLLEFEKPWNFASNPGPTMVDGKTRNIRRPENQVDMYETLLFNGMFFHMKFVVFTNGKSLPYMYC